MTAAADSVAAAFSVVLAGFEGFVACVVVTVAVVAGGYSQTGWIVLGAVAVTMVAGMTSRVLLCHRVSAAVP